MNKQKNRPALSCNCLKYVAPKNQNQIYTYHDGSRENSGSSQVFSHHREYYRDLFQFKPDIGKPSF